MVTRYQVQPFVVNGNAICTIQGVQEGDFDGMIFLCRNSFNPANPLANLVTLDDDGPYYGEGTSCINPRSFLFNDDQFLVPAGFYAAGSGTFSNQISCAEPANRVLVGYGIFGTNQGTDYDGGRAQLLGG